MRTYLIAIVAAVAVAAVSAAAAEGGESLPAVEPFHDFLVTRTIGVPSFIDGAVVYDPSADELVATGPGQATFAIPLDGGMRPRFVSVEVAGTMGREVEATAIVLDHASGTKRTRSGFDAGTSAAYRWIDIDVVGILSSAVGPPLPDRSQATMTVRVEFATGDTRARRVVMFYDRPAPRPPGEPFPDGPPPDLGRVFSP